MRANKKAELLTGAMICIESQVVEKAVNKMNARLKQGKITDDFCKGIVALAYALGFDIEENDGVYSYEAEELKQPAKLVVEHTSRMFHILDVDKLAFSCESNKKGEK